MLVRILENINAAKLFAGGVHVWHACERVRTHTRDGEKKLCKYHTVIERRSEIPCMYMSYTCTCTRIHVNIMRVETWVIRADARVRARAFLRHPLFHFASLFTCQLFSSLLFPSLHVCKTLCSLYILSYIYGSTKLHEALLSFVSLNSVTVTPHRYFRRRLFTTSAYVHVFISLCEPESFVVCRPITVSLLSFFLFVSSLPPTPAPTPSPPPTKSSIQRNRMATKNRLKEK